MTDAYGKWIPCSERLPTEPGVYLTWWEDQGQVCTNGFNKTWIWGNGAAMCDAKHITHWMPQPAGPNVGHGPAVQILVPVVRKPFAQWLREKISYHRSSFTAEDTQIAERVIIALSERAGPTDRGRLDWLESMHVEVRLPLVHGSRALFHASPEQGDGEETPSTIRGQIDYWIMHSSDKKGTT